MAVTDAPQHRGRTLGPNAWPEHLARTPGLKLACRVPADIPKGVQMSADTTQATLRERIHDELVDTVDEELELEIDDHRLAALLEHGGETENAIDRRTYFEELLRLQRELVKLQDWVVHQKLKVVVLFEGRDAAGKGGVIKRVTQRLNPRTCKVVALSAPTERERTQW
jgi:polyphosphate kinase 2 (PPK2 family)